VQSNHNPSLVYRRRLYQQIAEDIEQQILSGTFPPESRLPSEQELADRYGVSRNVVREALKSLKEQGLVAIRTGSGTYVRRPTVKPISEALNRFVRHSLDDFSIAHFYEIRRMIEPENAALAAERATDEDLRAICLSLRAMEERQEDLEAWSQADLEFHRSIASATHNPLVQSIIDALIDPLLKVIAAGHAEPHGTQAGLDAHKLITAAIQERDARRSYQAMLDHLIDSEKRLSRIGSSAKP
jgi:GntR family transcriptional repressor for pyruvate dehydrogenase complex